MLRQIRSVKEVKPYFEDKLAKKEKLMGFGHRVYKAYDPRARVLGPLAEELSKENKELARKYKIAKGLEKKVVSTLGKEKKIFSER